MGNEYWALDSRDGLKCTFYGLSSHANDSDFPHGNGIGSGSVCLCVDSGDMYMYYQPEDKWYEQ